MTELQRTVLLTGGSRGIGAGIAATLVAAGWKVVAPSRAELDLGDAASVASYLAATHEQLDGLVLNAATNDPAGIGIMTTDEWERIQHTNVTSNFLLVSELCPLMAERSFGRVLGVSSAYASRSRPGRAAYSASKAALEALVRSVAVEFAASGVIANCVAPGFVDTELTRRNNNEVALQTILERVPVGRLARADEIGRLAAFLMSPANEYITGQAIAVDGGFSCT